MRISLHRALGELKLIDNKINKQLSKISPVGFRKKGDTALVNGSIEREKFKESAISTYDSIRALIKRKTIIKTAIVLKNATTTVRVGEETMTIAEAITKKSYIAADMALLDKLKQSDTKVRAIVERDNTTVANNALKLVQAAMGSESDSKADEVDIIKSTYIENNEVVLVDPLQITEVIERLDNSIDVFRTEVDSVLSEANATTFIELED